MKRIVISLLAVLMVACAHSPVEIQVRPQVDVAPEAFGTGFSVSVQGANKLPGGGLGSLGGIYADQSQVRLGNNVEDALAETLKEGFRNWSFEPVFSGADVQVVASLTSLKYDSPNGLVTSKVDSSAEVQLAVTIGGSTYYGNYRSSGKDRNLIKPAKEEVEGRINGLLSATLQRAFEDEKLKSFLRANL
ncbi:YajG family lipoprotein [Microbulbifer sp. M83]|uniref:YajG family lipoprotein n=1 Tax=Microbulbifer sp. M83 TaxID=3118246 RepID=UPI002FE26B46